jgi:HK97 family phage major capsid protein
MRNTIASPINPPRDEPYRSAANRHNRFDRRSQICYDANSPAVGTQPSAAQRADEAAIAAIADGVIRKLGEAPAIVAINNDFKLFRDTSETNLKAMNTRLDATDLAIKEMRELYDSNTKLRMDPDVGIWRAPQQLGGQFTQRAPKEMNDFLMRVWKAADGRLEKEEVRELSSSVGPDGGYLIKPELISVIQTFLTQYGVVRKLFLNIPMKSNERLWPVLVGGVVAYWIAEGAPGIESFPQFTQVNMIVKKLVGLTHVSFELLEDADADLAQLLFFLFAQAMTYQEDFQGLRGNGIGANPFVGILNAVGTIPVVMPAGSTQFSQASADLLHSMQSAIATPFKTNCRYLFHPSSSRWSARRKNAFDQYIWQPPTANFPGSIWGYPYETAEAMPSLAESGPGRPFGIFGNFQNAYIGIRKEVAVARSDDYAFDQLEAFLRVHARESLKVANPQGFAVARTASQ